MSTSSRVSRVGSPSGGRGTLRLTTATGRHAEQVRLVDEGVHPGTAALARPGEPVGQEQGDPAVLVVEDLVDAHVGVVGGQVVPPPEAQAVQLVRRVEDAVLDDALELEPGPQRVGVDVEPLAAARRSA